MSKMKDCYFLKGKRNMSLGSRKNHSVKRPDQASSITSNSFVALFSSHKGVSPQIKIAPHCQTKEVNCTSVFL
jgi:hypothetical protein